MKTPEAHLKEIQPLMRCGNRTEFNQRLQWLSEGMLRNHLEGDQGAVSKQEIEQYRRFDEEDKLKHQLHSLFKKESLQLAANRAPRTQMHKLTIGTTKSRRPLDALVIEFGVRHIIRNVLPYFSITATLYRRGRAEKFGCLHSAILQVRPDLKPLVDLHGSHITGEPCNAEANGWFWLAGAAGGLGETYHGSITPGGEGLGADAPGQCQAMLAATLRIPPADAATLVQNALATDPATARQQFAQYIETQRPRWKAEADAAIQQFNLTAEK